jgi:hypothetical protein
LLGRLKSSAKNVLEVGIGDFTTKNGGSLKLWRDYFKNATIYGIDILSEERVLDDLKTDPRVKLYTCTDGYNDEFFNREFLDKGLKCDFMLDDGPHTIDSQQYSIAYWYKKLKIGGKLIIEDIGCRDGVPNPPESSDYALEQLIKVIPENITYKVFDLRDKDPGQYDSIILEINK